MRWAGAALRPPSGGDAESGPLIDGAARVAVKKWLIGAYLGYRRAASIALAPLTLAQLKRGGGPELLIVGRNR